MEDINQLNPQLDKEKIEFHFDNLFSDNESDTLESFEFFRLIDFLQLPEELALFILEKLLGVLDELYGDLLINPPNIDQMNSFKKIMRIYYVINGRYDEDELNRIKELDLYARFNFFSELAGIYEDAKVISSIFLLVSKCIDLLKPFYFDDKSYDELGSEEKKPQADGEVIKVDNMEKVLSFLDNLAMESISQSYIDSIGMNIPDKEYRNNILLEKLFRYAAIDMAEQAPKLYEDLMILISKFSSGERDQFGSFLKFLFSFLSVIKSKETTFFDPNYIKDDSEIYQSLLSYIDIKSLTINNIHTIVLLLKYLGDFSVKQLAGFFKSILTENDDDKPEEEGGIAVNIEISQAELMFLARSLFSKYKDIIQFEYEISILEYVQERLDLQIVINNINDENKRDDEIRALCKSKGVERIFENYLDKTEVEVFVGGFIKIIDKHLKNKAKDFIDLDMYVQAKGSIKMSDEDYNALHEDIVHYLGSYGINKFHWRVVIRNIRTFVENYLSFYEMGENEDRRKHPFTIILNGILREYYPLA